MYHFDYGFDLINLVCWLYVGIFLCDMFTRGSLSLSKSNKNLTSEFVTDFKLIGDCVFFITVINCNKRLNLALKSLAH